MSTLAVHRVLHSLGTDCVLLTFSINVLLRDSVEFSITRVPVSSSERCLGTNALRLALPTRSHINWLTESDRFLTSGSAGFRTNDALC